MELVSYKPTNWIEKRKGCSYIVTAAVDTHLVLMRYFLTSSFDSNLLSPATGTRNICSFTSFILLFAGALLNPGAKIVELRCARGGWVIIQRLCGVEKRDTSEDKHDN